MKRSAGFLSLLLIPLSACSSTSINVIETGMFSNDPEQIIKIYDRVEEISLNRDGELVTKNSLEAMGFNFKAPNVEEVPGPTAFRKIFGAPVFNETYEKGEQPGASLKDLEAYRGF